MKKKNVIKKKNKKPTLVIHSLGIESTNTNFFYSQDKFKTKNKLISVKKAKDLNQLIHHLEKYFSDLKNTSKSFRLVINQHGYFNGKNELGINKFSARKILQMLVDYGITDFSISSLGCNEGETKWFKEVAPEFTNHLKITIRSFKDGQTAYNALIGSSKNVKFCPIAINKANEVIVKREKFVFEQKKENILLKRNKSKLPKFLKTSTKNKQNKNIMKEQKNKIGLNDRKKRKI